MAVENDSRIVGFDGNAAASMACSIAEGTVYSVIEFDQEEFHPIYVANETVDMYHNVDHMHNHFNRIHTHVHMDFMEINTMTDSLFSAADEVRYITTAMDFLKLLRIYDDTQGLFLALDPDEPVVPIVDGIESVIEDSSDKP